MQKPSRFKWLAWRAIQVIFTLAALALVTFDSYILINQSRNVSAASALSNLAVTGLEVIDSVWEPTLKRTDNYTAVAVMGIDSRQLLFDGDTFKGKDRDIDSIMQIIYNHETGKIMALSIPRDTGVTISDVCARQASQYFRSINHAYKLAEDGKCPGGGIAMMQKYITYVTGFENHYFAVVSYQGFRDIINTLGEEKDGKRGLTIEVQRTFFDYYPRETGGGFERVNFTKGKQFIDSTTLLKYVRVRKASSDFDRAQRQQQVGDALQTHIRSSGVLSNPVQIYNLYQALSKNALFSVVSLDDIRGALGLLRNVDFDNVEQLVMDDTLGGKANTLITKPLTSGGRHGRAGYYLSPMAFNSAKCRQLEDEYCEVKAYLQTRFNATTAE